MKIQQSNLKIIFFLDWKWWKIVLCLSYVHPLSWWPRSNLSTRQRRSNKYIRSPKSTKTRFDARFCVTPRINTYARLASPHSQTKHQDVQGSHRRFGSCRPSFGYLPFDLGDHLHHRRWCLHRHRIHHPFVCLRRHWPFRCCRYCQGYRHWSPFAWGCSFQESRRIRTLHPWTRIIFLHYQPTWARSMLQKVGLRCCHRQDARWWVWQCHLGPLRGNILILNKSESFANRPIHYRELQSRMLISLANLSTSWLPPRPVVNSNPSRSASWDIPAPWALPNSEKSSVKSNLSQTK